MIWYALLGLLCGILVGVFSPLTLPGAYTRYISISLLACMDTVFGGFRANLEGNFDNLIFLTGFFVNALLAAFLVYLGDKIGVDFYLAALVAFGVRMFQNLAIIRRHMLRKFSKIR